MVFLSAPMLAVRPPLSQDPIFTFRAKIDEDYAIVDHDAAYVIKTKLGLTGKVKLTWFLYGQLAIVEQDGLGILTVKVL